LLQKCSITLKELEGNGTKESLVESENGHFEGKIEGVVAFIMARSNTENRFEGISKQMEMLRATVSHTCILQIQNATNP